MVAKVDSSLTLDIGQGSMPNFSPNGEQIAFSSAQEGVGICNADGSDRQIISRTGWGLQWSPDANLLAYGEGSQIYLWSVDKKIATPLLTGEAAQRYSHFYWNMAWSRDGRKIAFKGRRTGDNLDEFAVVSSDQPDQWTLLLDRPNGYVVSFSWSPNDHQILVSQGPTDAKKSLLFLLSATANKPAQPFLLPDVGGKVTGGAWSRDGKKLAFTLQFDPILVDWNGE